MSWFSGYREDGAVKVTLTMIVVSFLVLIMVAELCAEEPVQLARIVPKGSEVVQANVGTKFGFTEGPCWDGKDTLYFSDIENKRIMKLLPDGSFSVFREPSDEANGLMFNAEGNLVSCDGGARRVTVLDHQGTVIKVLADSYNGKKLNSPNDLVIDSKGGTYFTDPRFGSKEGVEQDKEAVYYLRPDGKLVRVVDDMVKPNGVILSPDEKVLCVGDSAAEYVRAYDIQPDGTVTHGRNFGRLRPRMRDGREIPSGADGLAMDSEGDLYVASSTGIDVFDKTGTNLGVIKVPEMPANCTFGGADMKTLFITARTGLYKIQLAIPGVRFPLARRTDVPAGRK